MKSESGFSFAIASQPFGKEWWLPTFAHKNYSEVKLQILQKKNGDVTHSEEEIGPAGVQVDRQLDKWAAISWKYMQLHAVHKNFSDDHPNCET